MFGDDDDGYQNGAAMDPVMILGPRAARLARSKPVTEGSVSEAEVMASPLAGAGGSPSNKQAPGPGAIVRSPVGWLLVLLVLAYLAFDRVFGEAS